MNLHGFARATGDLDLFLSFDPKNLDIFFSAVRLLGLRPRIPVALEDFADEKKRKVWIKQKGLKVFSLFHPRNPLESVDIMIQCPLDFEGAYKKRVNIDVGDFKISTVSFEDLLTMKRKAGRPRDLLDIDTLRQIARIKRATRAKKSQK